MTSVRSTFVWAAATVLVYASAGGVSPAQAQGLGTLGWQLQPYCNVVTMTVTQNGNVYTLDGYDDQCGAATRAALVGLATPNPNGTIGLGVTITTPTGAAVHVDATITLPAASGTWRDSVGHSGTFAFGASTGGNPRPPVVPSSPSTAATYTAPQTFNGGISAGGTAITSVGAPTNATDAATKGYVDAGDAALTAALPAPGQFTFRADGGFVARGQDGVGNIPASGAGERLMWYPAKAALRAGTVTDAVWDAANVGFGSTAFGFGTLASGNYSHAGGFRAEARGVNSLSFGSFVGACSDTSIALGYQASTSSAPTPNDPCGGTLHLGAFVFASQSLSSVSPFATVADNEFAVRATGGIRLRTSSTANTGCNLAAGSGVWNCTSDRASKHGFEPIDGEDVLRKLLAMPIDRWSYKTEPGVQHVGPVAQDFRAAFGLGTDDVSIGHIDVSGIALRAVQALEARSTRVAQATTADLADLRAESARLRSELDAIKRALSSLSRLRP